jgi:hypothetical protein
MRLTKSSTSCSLNAFASDSIGMAWRTDANSRDGAPPTRWVGESTVTSSGCSASSRSSSRMSLSYSASVIVGSSSA